MRIVKPTLRALMAAVAALTFATLASPASAGPQEKVELCHLAQGSGKLVPVTVSAMAVEAHLAHGDILVGDGVGADCEAIATPEIVVSGNFSSFVGTTTADSAGLTYSFNDVTFNDPSAVYVEAYWGTYPLYLPGSEVSVVINLENVGSAASDLTIVFSANQLNLDGSIGASVTAPQANSVSLAAGDTLDMGFSAVLPKNAKQLDVANVLVYEGDPANDVLLHHLQMIFCPPEM